MLDGTDFAPNGHAPEFGEHGVCYVRYGKAMTGSVPKPRSVLTVPDIALVVDVLVEWTERFRPLFGRENSPALWPTERSDRLAVSTIGHRFAAYRDALGLSEGLDFHSLRRSYITH